MEGAGEQGWAWCRQSSLDFSWEVGQLKLQGHFMTLKKTSLHFQLLKQIILPNSTRPGTPSLRLSIPGLCCVPEPHCSVIKRSIFDLSPGSKTRPPETLGIYCLLYGNESDLR